MSADRDPRPRRWHRLVIVAAVFAAGVACAAVGCGRTSPSAATGSSASPRPPASALRLTSPLRSPRYDDSGFGAAGAYFLPIKDPRSLEHIRDCYQGAGYRGVEALRRQLAQDNPFPEQRLEMLQRIARLYLFEGEFRKASEALEEARALAESDPPRLGPALPEVILLQGVAALRRGETENCVECACGLSCIFPLQPAAYHQKPDGSRQAVRFFTEYLRYLPDDVGVHWLLNVAYMTLGEYPDGVPPQYLIPLAPFRSEFDVGRFRDIAPQLGVDRLSMSGGAIMDDFDNDGLLDLVETTSDEGMAMAFFRNKGDGTFEDRTRAAGLEKQLGGLYCVQTDYNNDGWLDIYIARGGWKQPMRHSLLRNNGDGTFTDVTEQAGLATPVASQAAAWADYDNDGWLDLFVGSELVMVDGRPVPTRSRLYHNKGDGTFEEVALPAGVANEGFLCKGANWGDFDGDGYPDLFVANYNGPCRLFRNNRDGTFTDVARPMGVTKPHTAFSCWWFDYDNDGWLDLFVASFDRTLPDVIQSHLGRPFQAQSCRLYRNLQGKGFEDVTEAAGLLLAMPVMGSNFVDVDNDGFLDFYLGTGDPNYSMLVPNRLFRNVQGKRFADVTMSSGTGHLQKGHGVACGDWDRDGNVDLYVHLGGATPGDRFRTVLWQNPGHDHHWLTVKLVGKKTNRAAIGARIKVTVAGEPPNTFYRRVTTGSSFGANALQQTIGLGKASRIARLEIEWPTSRTTQVFEDVAVDQAIEITEFDRDYRRLNWGRVPVPR
jgi:tetratricopeptide (TPR) repeat protein